MPAAPVHKIAPLAYAMLAIFLIAVVGLCYAKPITIFIVGGIVLLGWLLTHRERIRLRKMAQSRTDEGICEFARSFAIRDTDTWVIRAVYEELQKYLKRDVERFPLRASDRFDEDLRIDNDELYDIAYEVACRTGYDLTETQNNPFYDKVITVKDMVHFLCKQPKNMNAEQAVPGYPPQGVGSPEP